MSGRTIHLLPLAVLLVLGGGTFVLLRILPRETEAPLADDGRPLAEVTVTPLPQGGVKLVERRLGVMGTEVTITVFGRDEATLRAATARAFDRIEEMESRLSTWRKDSDISRVNAGAGRAVPVDGETWEIVARALEYARPTRGAFDVTAGAVIALWRKRESPPGDAEVAEARARVGVDRVHLVWQPDPAIRLEPGTRLDVAGCVKGTIVDQAMLALGPVDAALVNAGGDMLARGSPPGGRGLLVASRDPRRARGETLAEGRLRLVDSAVCTSGSYERPQRVGETRVSHIVDPRTGRPVADHVLQATVVAPRCEPADALATALMVLPADEGLALIETMEGVEAMLVIPDGEGIAIRETSGFDDLRAEEAR